MKLRLLTALVASCCISQMAVADDLTTGSITNKTTATATLTISQPITLENVLTPVSGLKTGGTDSTIARGVLKIKDSGVSGRLAVMTVPNRGVSFVSYAVGHENDDKYKLSYSLSLPLETKFKMFNDSDGAYAVTDESVSQIAYSILRLDKALPLAGNYIISATGAVYNP